MLARDEADRIAGVAAAVGDVVDDYCVLIDHRSADDTEGAIERELGDEGRIVPFRFRDFAHARNALLDAARQGLGDGDYLMLVDPDSPPAGALPAELTADVYECEWRMGATTWAGPILLRAGAAARYEGACHELLHYVGSTGVASQLRVDVAAKPDNPERWELYRELLSRDADTNPRSAFYLARTFEQLGRPLEAVGQYLQRAALIGWDEETYLCLLTAGTLMQPYDLETMRNLLERARKYRPSRLEAVYHLARLANMERRHGDAAELAIAGLRMPRSTDRLMVDRFAERDGLGAQLATALAELATAAQTTLPTEEVPHG